MRAATLTFFLGLAAGTGLTAVGSDFHPIRSVGSVAARTAPPGTATIHMLAADAQSAFVGLLEISPGAGVPEHQDESEEFIYVLEGGGAITVDGQPHTIGAGDLVYMPAGATVSFAAGEAGPTRVLQIFAPAASAAKYDAWQP
jgi:quercetin dioxygenase-like cupin family protein